MKEFSFLHISDLHLCEPFNHTIYLDGPILREEMWNSLKNAVDFANDRNIDFIFITGDIFNKDYFNIFYAGKFFEILSKFNGKKIFIIFGNHDFADERNIMLNIDLPENIVFHFLHTIEEFKIDELDLSVFLHSWTKEVEIVPDFNNLKLTSKRNILLLHSGTTLDKGYMPVEINALKKFNYVALGHIHKPTKLSENAFYPGSLTPLSIAETGAHGGIYGRVGTRLETEFVPLSNLRYFDILANVNETDFQHLVKSLKPNNGINILRLTFTGDLDLSLDINYLKYELEKNYKSVQIVDNRRFNKLLIEKNSVLFAKISEFAKLHNLNEKAEDDLINNIVKNMVE